MIPVQVSCDVNGHGRQLVFRGRYAEVGPVGQGDIVALTFPISEQTLKTRIGGKSYTVTVKGNTVVMRDPPGKYSPLYQRAHYRESKVRWVERERFVADQFIAW